MSTKWWVLLLIAGILVVLTAVMAVVLAVRLVGARRLLREAGIPVENKLAFWGALLYLISPVDLLPDPILLDDIGFLLLALRSLHAAAASAGVYTKDRKHQSQLAPVITPYPRGQ